MAHFKKKRKKGIQRRDKEIQIEVRERKKERQGRDLEEILRKRIQIRTEEEEAQTESGKGATYKRFFKKWAKPGIF